MTGIRKLHSRHCPAKRGRRCSCGAGYEASIFASGRRVRRTFPTLAAARSWRHDASLAAERGTIRPNRDRRSLSEALADLIAGMEAGAVRPRGRSRYKPNTVRSYSIAHRRHIEGSALGAIRLREVRRRDLQAFADDLLASGLAPSSVANVLSPIQALYRRAIDRDELAYNPAERINLPTDSEPRPKRIASPAEAAKLLAALPELDRPIWATALYGGLRRGELQALRWRDVDLGASRIAVERSWDQVEGPIEPKSRASRREVPLLAILRDHLDHLALDADDPDALVFGRTGGRPFAPMAIGKRARKAWAEEGLEAITLHECRHTFASLLIAAGVNAKAIQAYMGHSKIATTFDTYGHLLPGSGDEVRERMDAYLADNGSCRDDEPNDEPASLAAELEALGGPDSA